MRILFSAAILLFILNSSSYPQSYKVDIGSSERFGDFYSPVKTLELRKPAPGTYLQNSFYIKSKDNISTFEIEKFVKLYLINSGYIDLKITEIRKSFSKYFGNNLLNKSSNRLENIFQISIENNFDVFDLCSLLTQSPEINYACPVIAYKFSDFKPNDESVDQQWYLESLNMFKAWDIARGDKSIVIGIVDSGTDYNHDELISQVWTNSGEISGDGIDNDGNGFIDDVHGWDFVGNITLLDAVKGKFKEDNNPIPVFTTNDHGTHVAGSAAATTNNTIGIASTGFDVTFMPVKIALDDLSKSRMVYRPYDGILYAAMNGADVINCSWASSYQDPLAWDVINEILDMGVTIVAAAGNENLFIDYTPYYPAAMPGVIAVGSVNPQDVKSSFSNFGTRVICFAPGENIFSLSNSNRYVSKTGSSMSSPLATGIAATVKKIFPNYSTKAILHQIRSTTSPIQPQSQLLSGKINAFDAFRYNNPMYPAYKIPGISMEKIMIEGASSITKTGQTKVKLSFKNYLGTASNIYISLSPQDNYFEISPKVVNLQQLNANQSIEIEFTVTLNESCPWFEGDAFLLINYEADGYKDVELIEIPIRLESNNKFLLVESFDESFYIDWHASDVAGKFDYWAVGYDLNSEKGVMYNFGKNNGLYLLTSDTLVDISAANDKNIMIAANGKDSKTTVMRSFNSGKTFSDVDVSQFFQRITGIKNINISDAFAYGINCQGAGEIIYSIDGGASFEKSVLGFTIPGGSEEYPSSKTAYRNGEYYIGTSTGRIIKSSDNGRNWQMVSDVLKGKISHLAVVNKDSIFVILNQIDSVRLYVSNNGGKKFSKVDYEITDLQTAVKLFVPDSSNTVYILTGNSKIYLSSDMGSSWKPELSYRYKFGDIYSAAVYSGSGKVRLWMAGYDINYLDFDLIPANIIRDVRIAGKSEIDFDTVDINKFSEDIIFIENKGNVRSKIISQNFTSGKYFELSKELPGSIAPSELLSADVKFSSKSIGRHYDTLLVTTDASDEPLKFIFEGFCIDPATVSDSENESANFRLVNLVGDLYRLDIYSELSGQVELNILDINGSIVKNCGKYEHSGSSSSIIFSGKELSSGMYFLKINGFGIEKALKLIVIR